MTGVEDFSLYTFINIYKYRKVDTRALIGLDVTASGLQIMSLICGSKKGLILTKVIEGDEENEKDIYWHIHKNVVNKYPIMKFMKRAQYKAIIMKLSYGESTYSRAHDIKNYLLGIGLVKSRLEKTINTIEGLTDEEKRQHIPSNYTIAKMYDYSMEMEFDRFKLLRKHINYIVDTRTKWNLPINFHILDVYKTSQYYNLDKAKVYHYLGYKGHSKRLTMYVPQMIDEVKGIPKRFDAVADKKRTKRATIPNFIHHIDSCILQKVLTRMRYNNLPLFTVHDAFYCRLTDVEFLKDAYFEFLKEVQRKNPWLLFVYNNRVEPKEIDDSFEKERITFNDNLEKMCRSMPYFDDLKETKRHPDILS